MASRAVRQPGHVHRRPQRRRPRPKVDPERMMLLLRLRRIFAGAIVATAGVRDLNYSEGEDAYQRARRASALFAPLLRWLPQLREGDPLPTADLQAILSSAQKLNGQSGHGWGCRLWDWMLEPPHFSDPVTGPARSPAVHRYQVAPPQGPTTTWLSDVVLWIFGTVADAADTWAEGVTAGVWPNDTFGSIVDTIDAKAEAVGAASAVALGAPGQITPETAGEALEGALAILAAYYAAIDGEIRVRGGQPFSPVAPTLAQALAPAPLMALTACVSKRLEVAYRDGQPYEGVQGAHLPGAMVWWPPEPAPGTFYCGPSQLQPSKDYRGAPLFPVLQLTAEPWAWTGAPGS